MWMLKGVALALVFMLTACSSTMHRGEPTATTNERSDAEKAIVSSPEPASPAVEQATKTPPAIAPVARTETASDQPKPAILPAPEATPRPEPDLVVQETPVAKPAATPVAKPKPAPTPVVKPKPAPTPVVVKPKPEAKPKTVVQEKPEPKPVADNSIAGRLALDAGPGQRIASGEVAQAVVYFLPRSGGAKPKPGRFSIATHSKGFKPALSVVPIGSTVRFPNTDEVLHNVFSITPGSAFNLGIYAPGESRSVKLSKAGLVVVNCNVHNNMRAYVLVLSTPYYTRPRADGRFVLDDLPPGPGTLVFWHPRAQAQSQAITGPLTKPVTRTLVASRPSLDSHQH